MLYNYTYTTIFSSWASSVSFCHLGCCTWHPYYCYISQGTSMLLILTLGPELYLCTVCHSCTVMPLTPLIIENVSPFVTGFGSLLFQTWLQALLTHTLSKALEGTPFSLIASWHLNARWSIHWSSSCQKIQKVSQNIVQSSEKRGDKYRASWYFLLLIWALWAGMQPSRFCCILVMLLSEMFTFARCTSSPQI